VLHHLVDRSGDGQNLRLSGLFFENKSCMMILSVRGVFQQLIHRDYPHFRSSLPHLLVIPFIKPGHPSGMGSSRLYLPGSIQGGGLCLEKGRFGVR
jgi:hypothetical protein